jgi:hypothetical protein
LEMAWVRASGLASGLGRALERGLGMTPGSDEFRKRLDRM